jgi:hypothetical protein
MRRTRIQVLEESETSGVMDLHFRLILLLDLFYRTQRDVMSDSVQYDIGIVIIFVVINMYLQ